MISAPYLAFPSRRGGFKKKKQKRKKKERQENVFVICFLLKEKQQSSAASSHRLTRLTRDLIASLEKKKEELVPFSKSAELPANLLRPHQSTSESMMSRN